MPRQSALPATLSPRLICREAAAAYLSIGTTKWDELVRDGRMPRPKRIDGRVVWDVRAIDVAVDELPNEQDTSHNPWDDEP